MSIPSSHSTLEIESLEATFAQAIVHVDQTFIGSLKSHIEAYLSIVPILVPNSPSSSRTTSIRVPMKDLSEDQIRTVESSLLVIRKLRVGSISLVVTVHAGTIYLRYSLGPENEPFLRFLEIGVFLGFSNTPIHLPTFTFSDVPLTS